MVRKPRIKPLFFLIILLTIIPLTIANSTTILPVFPTARNPAQSSNIAIPPSGPSFTTPGPDLGITNWTNNHILNPRFEDWPLSHPQEWSVQINTDRYNWHATQPPWFVSQGTYSAGMQTRRGPTMPGFTYWYQNNVNADMRNLTLSFDYYADSIPSLDYDYFFTSLALSDGRYIWYLLVGAQSLSVTNQTNIGYYQLFSPASTWNVFNRNITSDYLALGLFPGTIVPGLVVNEIRFYIQTGTASDEWLRVFFDDVWLQNETTTFIGGPIRDGNIESGWFNPWFHSGNYDQSYLSKSNTAHEGVNSCNMTAASIGNASFVQIDQTPHIRISNQNQGSVRLWWHLTQENVGMFDYSMVQFQFYNLSGYFNLYYILSHGDTFPYTNTSYSQYILANNFNTTGSWQQFLCNPWDGLSATFNTNDAILNRFVVLVYSGSVNARVELLVDDIHFIARAVSDADYEDQNDIGSPILGWNRDYSWDFTVTDQGYGGGKAANCSLGFFEVVYLEHDLNERPLNSSRETYFDVMWRLEAFDSILIEFYLYCEDGRYIHYILATNNWGSFTNSSNAVYYNVTGSGITGSWRQLHRDLVHDYEAAFGSLPNTTLQELFFYASCDVASLEVHLDDLYIYDDPAPRLTNPMMPGSPPLHNNPVPLDVDAEDQDLDTVLLIYRINSGSYQFLPMVHQTGNTYQASIPGQPYATLVEYYFQANDTWGMSTILQAGLNHYQYTVDEEINPDVTITTPTAGATVNDTIMISVTATDAESGVNRVEFDVDGTPVSTDTTSPYNYDLDTTTLTDGSHTITATAYDNADNHGTDSVTITVQNQPPTTPPPPPPAIPGFPLEALFLGLVSALGIIVVIRRRRTH